MAGYFQNCISKRPGRHLIKKPDQSILTVTTYIKLALFFTGTLVATIIFILVLLEFSKTLGIRGKNNTEKRWNQNVKPSIGGIAIFLSVFISIVTYLVSHPTENVFSNSSFIFFFLGMCLAFFMGLTDDAFDTKPLMKLGSQIMCGILVVASNNVIPVSGFFEINALFTVFWTVGVMNSLNMLDNMDGITASAAIAIFIQFMVINLWFCCNVLDVYVFILIGFIGSALGFLTYNKPPSKLFMGDSGSQLIGYTVAFFSVYLLWDFKGVSEIPFWLSTLTLMMILAVPFVDTFTVVFNRIKRGVSPAKGGKDHTTHHLFYAGFSEVKVWITFSLISIVLGGLGIVMLYLYNLGVKYWILPLITPLLGTFYFLFRLTHVVKSPTPNSKSTSNS
jgi:UDP-GlcNAc:undecaprenyl-phosphate GlcNAc-1-phosphate transferase